jgi:hypothetical protein
MVFDDFSYLIQMVIEGSLFGAKQGVFCAGTGEPEGLTVFNGSTFY